MDLNRDFFELIQSSTSQEVDFLIVGAYALAFHGVVRRTANLDIWIRRSDANVARLQTALVEFGLQLSDVAVESLCGERKLLRFGKEPRLIQIWNFLDGCDFDVAWERADQEVLDEVPVRILGLTDLVASKRAKDDWDLVLLRSMIGPLPGDPKSRRGPRPMTRGVYDRLEDLQ